MRTLNQQREDFLAKIRINKLALELNVQNDQIIDALNKKDISVKNYMSSIDEEAVAYMRELFSPKPVAKKTAKKKAVDKEKKSAKKKAATPTTAKVKKETKKKEAPKKEAPVKAKAPAVKAKTKAKLATQAAKPKAKEATQPKVAKKIGLKIVKTEEKPKERTKKTPAPKAKLEEKILKPEAEAPKKTPEPQAPPVEVQDLAEEEESFETVHLPDNISIRNLADKLSCTPNDLIKDLMSFGVLTTINQTLDFDVASKVADKRGFEVERLIPESELDFEEEEQDLERDQVPRPSIVTIMGHVDHGKTSLLDAIRKTNLNQKEAGGITQRIGAYQVKVKGTSIVFLDTPGHEAFTAMRARGAQVTDIVVLVVAADDGLKPQTKEAIDHANAAEVPIVVAINKIDKPEAKTEEVRKQLADEGLLSEEWGGQTIFAEVSALHNKGIDKLLEMILLQAEIMELKGNPKLRAWGVVIESKLDKGRGPVATLIVQKGTLRIGDPFIVGPYFGKVRALINDKGQSSAKAPPSTPVEVVGMPEVPQPGDKFIVVGDERKARQLSNLRVQQQREYQLAQTARVTMEDLHLQIIEGKIQELNLIIKADVQGSSHAVQEAFSKLGTDKVRVKVIHEAVGGITESDVLLSTASNAIIIGFNVRPTEKAAQLAARENVDIRHYSIIYDAIEDIKKAMDGMLVPAFTERIVGRAEVRRIFTIPKIGSVAGCQVTSGKIERNLDARLIRDSVVVYQGKIGSLKRFKEDVKEVQSGYECGLSFEKYQDLKKGDVVEPFILDEVLP